jgi:outer membrane protein assembly factor BamB
MVLATIIATVRPTLAQLANSAWPMFHHDTAHTGLGSIDTSANPGTVKWSVTCPGAADFGTSPVIAPDGTVYVGCHDYHLYAYNPDGSQK